jgi:type IV secretion system protein VirD4
VNFFNLKGVIFMETSDATFAMIKSAVLNVVGFVFLVVFMGFLWGTFLAHSTEYFAAPKDQRDWKIFLDTSVIKDTSNIEMGLVITGGVYLMWLVYNPTSAGKRRRIMNQKNKAVDTNLENSRWMNDKERDKYFPPCRWSGLSKLDKDGVPVRAVYKNGDVYINLASPMHVLTIGSTGSGKTTTFVNPMIQILAHTNAHSSMIVTDPKGELFAMHSKMLKEHGYDCMVLDLRDAYSSFRWNPLSSIYDDYQRYVDEGRVLYKRRDNAVESGLKLMNKPEEYGEVWHEYDGKAYAIVDQLVTEIKVAKQKIFDEAYEDLNDLCSVLCPVESKDDPVWEKGAKSMVLSILLAMLEDSEDPELGLTKDKFCFFNVNKALSNSENNFEELKRFFCGRSPLSKAVTLSRQVLSAADTTLASYMSIAFDKMSMFNDEGICSLTSATDIDPSQLASKPTALFLKIPDEKDTRHPLAAVFILSIYKALIKIASAREDLSLPRSVYFILDEFGNMPKIDKFDKMITVGRSRKIWFTLIVQSYAQLENVYTKVVGDIMKSNCGIKMFIGSNDIETCKEFSELCGNMTVQTSSVSAGTGDKGNDVSVSSQVQTRALIYPSELQKLNNQESTGNTIVCTFGNYPLMTKYTPSYKCPLYEFGTMDISEVKSNAFFSDKVYYHLPTRNQIIENRMKKAQEAKNNPPPEQQPEPMPEVPDQPVPIPGEEGGDAAPPDAPPADDTTQYDDTAAADTQAADGAAAEDDAADYNYDEAQDGDDAAAENDTTDYNYDEVQGGDNAAAEDDATDYNYDEGQDDAGTAEASAADETQDTAENASATPDDGSDDDGDDAAAG